MLDGLVGSWPVVINGHEAAGGRPWVVEYRYQAVLQVLEGAGVAEVARQVGTSRQSLYAWTARYREAGLARLADRSRRPRNSPARLEATVCELRRQHPRWGAQRIAYEQALATLIDSVGSG